MTIEQLPAEQSDFCRLADAAERIANALEKIAGASEAQPSLAAPRPVMCAPAAGGGKCHALRQHGNPDDHEGSSWRWSLGSQAAPEKWCQGYSSVPLDMTRVRPASEVPETEYCRHPACYQQLTGVPHRRPRAGVTPATP